MSIPLAFSTLGCPGWDLDRILSAAVDYGYDAVELRGYLDVMDLPQAEPFTPGNRAETLRRFADAGLSVCCVSSSGVVTQGNTDHVRSHAELAHELNSPLVRVFGGSLKSDIPHEEAFAQAVDNLRAFGDIAAEAGVQLVLETHDSFSTGESVAQLIAATGHPSVYSLWDLHHPYRQGESPADSLRFLGPSIRHIHVKDSKPGGAYCLLGEGDIPVFSMLDLLLGATDEAPATTYSGAISLEWEKRWHPEIAEPEIAFPQYARALRGYLEGRGAV